MADAQPAIEDADPGLSVRIGAEALSLSRVARAASAGPTMLSAAPEDAFMLVFQLKPFAAHEIRQGGRPKSVARGPAHVFSLFDLANGVTAQVDGAIDSMHFKLPRAALDAFAESAGRPRIASLDDRADIFQEVDPMVTAFSGPLVEALRADGGAPLLADHLLLGLTAHVVDRYGAGTAIPAASGGLTPWQERRAKAMLDASGDAPPLADVAAASGVSVRHFARAFKQSVGTTPWAWHAARRIDRAGALLRDTSLSLARVALAAGFADQSHFTHAFTKARGVSPGKWRRDHGLI